MMTFVQIGANTGYDTFTKYCNYYKPDKIILVEPFEEHHAELKKCYSNFKDVNCAALAVIDDPNLSSIDIFVQNNTAHATIMPLKDWDLNKCSSISVPAVTFDKLMSYYGISKIDLLFIDTEGNDARIINSIDFDKLTIRALYYEKWFFKHDDYSSFHPLHGESGMKIVNDKLTSLGYSIIEDGANFIARKMARTERIELS